MAESKISDQVRQILDAFNPPLPQVVLTPAFVLKSALLEQTR